MAEPARKPLSFAEISTPRVRVGSHPGAIPYTGNTTHEAAFSQFGRYQKTTRLIESPNEPLQSTPAPYPLRADGRPDRLL